MNQYHIYDKIGRGKHSTVYKGRKKKTIQYYAVKSVDKSQKPRVLQEVRRRCGPPPAGRPEKGGARGVAGV
jgi:serine/threonine protein kinase